jgi:predicted TPR repeat methyltransferase
MASRFELILEQTGIKGTMERTNQWAREGVSITESMVKAADEEHDFDFIGQQEQPPYDEACKGTRHC